MLSDLADGYKYDKSETVASPIIVKNTLVDYAAMVKREGGKSKVSNVLVIDMDAIKNSLGIVPTPQSMDVAFVVSKSSEYESGLNKSIKLTKKYILADFKFNVISPDKVDKNISNDDIKGKFDFSISYIREKDINIPCCNFAYFIFNDTNYQQIRNRWSRRNLNSPKSMAVKQSDFETLF